MTSSSDAGMWQPLELAGAPFGTPPRATAFTPTLVPEGASAADIATSAASSWLPSLRTTAQMTAAKVRKLVEEEAFSRGRTEATRTERELADARCATALQAVARAASHLDTIAAEFAQDRERDMQALAIAVARHIVQQELAIDPARVGELVRRALDLLPLDHSIEVRLHPEDLHTLAPSLEGLRPEGRQVHLQWVGDPTVERGGFVAETPHRIVDGRVDVALRALYERFDHD
jgi:flagellar biosynthesis/type III secretory pathway protein FliH